MPRQSEALSILVVMSAHYYFSHSGRTSELNASRTSFSEDLSTLRAFEGTRCLWRAPAAVALLLMPYVVAVLAVIATGLMAVNGRVLGAVVTVALGVGFERFGLRVRARFPWRAVVSRRLGSYERPNPLTEVTMLVRPEDAPAARAALRHAKFNPGVYSLVLSEPPLDATDLSCRIAVCEPEAWRQSASDLDRLQRMAAVMEGAGIRARVGRIDTCPESTVQ